MDVKPIEQVDDVRGEADRDAHVAEGVFEDEVPADDPRDQLSHRRVGVGIGRSGNGDHRRQLCVAQAGERTDNGHQHERESQSRA